MSSVAESFAHRRVRLGNVEPAAVALLRQLDPLIVVLSLFCCERAFGQQPSPAFVALALLTWVISGQLFDRVGASEAASLGYWDFSRSYTRVLLQWVTVVGMLFLAGLTFKTTDILGRQSILTWFVVTPVALSVTHLLRRRVRWRTEHVAAPRYIIIGVNDVGVELARRLPPAGFMGYFDFRTVDRVAQVIDPEKLAGHCRDTANFVREKGVKVVYIALPLANVPRMSELVNDLRDTTASIYYVPDIFVFDLIQGRLVEIHGMPVVAMCETPLHGIEA